MVQSWVRVRQEELCNETQALDTMFWGSLVRRNPSVQRVLKQQHERVIGGDLFTSLYHWNPKLKKDPPNPALAGYLERLMENPGFQQLREKTKGQQGLAAATAVKLYRELMRQQQSEFKTVVSMMQSQDMAKGEAEAGAGKEQAEMLDKAISQAQEAMRKAGAGKGVGARVEDGVEKVGEDLDTAEELSEFGDGSGSGQGGCGLDPNNRQEKLLQTLLNEQLIERVTSQDKVRAIFRVAGRMRGVLEAARNRKPTKAEVSDGVKYGSDLEGMVGGELVYLTDPELEDLFWAKYSDGGLLVKEKKDRQRQGKGPFVFVCDLSGSMSGAREQQALGLFVVMARMAIRDNRKVMFVPFADNYESIVINGTENLLTALTKRWRIGQGTDIRTALEFALGVVEKERVFKKADVVVVSDGDVWVSEHEANQLSKKKEELDCKVMGVSVTGFNWRGPLMKVMDGMSVMNSGRVSDLKWLEQSAEQLV